MADGAPLKRKKISNETIKAFYPIIRAVARQELPRPKGIAEISKQFGVNINSARDFVDNFGKMLKGEEYQRLNTIYGTGLYLDMIRKDFGADALTNAVSSVRKHLAYYEGVSGNQQRGIRKILEKYSDFATSEADQSRESVARKAKELDEEHQFDPDNDEDARERVLASIARRQGQPKFRERLLALYGGRCAISRCQVEAVLEAAHIRRYLGPHTNHPTNGLLLRSDLHTLFDQRMIAIDSKTLKVLISPDLKGTSYEKRFAGKTLVLPKVHAGHPNTKALDKQREECGL